MNTPPTAFQADPENPVLPDDLPGPSGDGGEVVLVLVEESARRAGWPVGMGVQLARRWAEQGSKVFLADGDLAEAPLHDAVGAQNAEGIADMIVHGASPGRVAQRVADGGFLFASAGTVVPDPVRVYEHPRWPSVLSAFRESGSVLLLYLPAEAVPSGLLAEGDRVIRLTADPAHGEPDPGVTLIQGPGADSSAEGAGTPVVDAASTGDETSTEDVPAESVPPEAAPASASTRSSRRSKEAADENRTRMILLVILLLVVAFAFLGQWLGYFDLPGFASGLESFSSHPTASG